MTNRSDAQSLSYRTMTALPPIFWTQKYPTARSLGIAFWQTLFDPGDLFSSWVSLYLIGLQPAILQPPTMNPRLRYLASKTNGLACAINYWAALRLQMIRSYAFHPSPSWLNEASHSPCSNVIPKNKIEILLQRFRNCIYPRKTWRTGDQSY